LKTLRIHITCLIICAIALATCTPKPIAIDLPDAEQKPVIWSQVVPANVTLIYLARSFSALEFQEGDSSSAQDLVQQFLVQDGLVVLTHNDTTDTLIQITDGLFASFNTELIAGDSYQLYAKDFSNGKEITSQAVMMSKVSLDTATAEVIDTSKVRIHYSFQDPLGPNWYAIHFYSTYANPLELDDPFSAENLVETQLISDLEFGSSSIENSRLLENLDNDTVFVSLNNISEEYFNYLSQRQRGGTIYNQLVQEPINYISNIGNGYGMFALHFPDVKMIVLPE
jgi:hypothetical protein